jgi:hypothetical protein
MKVHHPDEYAEFLLLDSEEEKTKVSYYEILRDITSCAETELI